MTVADVPGVPRVLQVGRAHAEQLSKLRARVPSAPPAPSALVTISAPASSSAYPLDQQGAQALPPAPMASSAAPAVARGPESSATLALASVPASTSSEELMAQKRHVAAQLAAKVRAVHVLRRHPLPSALQPRGKGRQHGRQHPGRQYSALASPWASSSAGRWVVRSPVPCGEETAAGASSGGRCLL